MTDSAPTIILGGGLDEVSSDAEVSPGAVRRSLNYEVVAEGGYRRIGGRRPWTGLDLTPRTDALEVVEVAKTNGELTKAFAYAEGERIEHRVVGIVQRASTTLVVVEKRRATEALPVGSVLDGGMIVTDAFPDLTAAEEDAVFEAISSYGQDSWERAFGRGPIDLVHEHDGTLYVARDSLDNPGRHHIQRAAIDEGGSWIRCGLIEVPDGSEGSSWHAYSYQFAGQRPTLFIATGRGDPYRVWREADGTDRLAKIDDRTTEPPINVVVHANHLFLAYRNGEIRFSGLGDPTNFDNGAGSDGTAGSFNVGDVPTGFQVLSGGALAIYCADRISILLGTSGAFRLEVYSDEAGAIEGTVQNMPTSIFCERRAITTLAASDTYGNFTSKALSQGFDPAYQRIRSGGRLFSLVNRAKSQYRIFNEDGRGLFLTFVGQKLAGAMEVDFNMRISAVGTLGGDEDRSFIASATSGIVYVIDSGSRFFQDEFEAFFELPQAGFGSPRRVKRFKQAILEGEGDPRARLDVTNVIDDGHERHEDTVPVDAVIESRDRPRYRNELLSRFAQTYRGIAYLVGAGLTQALRIRSLSGHGHTIRSIAVHMTKRGQRR